MSSPPPQIGQGLRRLKRWGAATVTDQTDPKRQSAASAAHADRCSRGGRSPKSRQRALDGNGRVRRRYASKVTPSEPARVAAEPARSFLLRAQVEQESRLVPSELPRPMLSRGVLGDIRILLGWPA